MASRTSQQRSVLHYLARHLADELPRRARLLAQVEGPGHQATEVDEETELRLWAQRRPEVSESDLYALGYTPAQVAEAVYPNRRRMIRAAGLSPKEQAEYAERMAKRFYESSGGVPSLDAALLVAESAPRRIALFRARQMGPEVQAEARFETGALDGPEQGG